MCKTSLKLDQKNSKLFIPFKEDTNKSVYIHQSFSSSLYFSFENCNFSTQLAHSVPKISGFSTSSMWDISDICRVASRVCLFDQKIWVFLGRNKGTGGGTPPVLDFWFQLMMSGRHVVDVNIFLFKWKLTICSYSLWKPCPKQTKCQHGV